MTHVSKKILDNKTKNKLINQFSSLFANTNTQDVSSLFEIILTPAERIMLIKRVAIVLMLTENFSTYKIAKTLKVSDSTVRLIRKQYLNKEFSFLLKKTKNSEFDLEKFWETVDVLLRLGMPSRGGRGRWDFLNK